MAVLSALTGRVRLRAACRSILQRDTGVIAQGRHGVAGKGEGDGQRAGLADDGHGRRLRARLGGPGSTARIRADHAATSAGVHRSREQRRRSRPVARHPPAMAAHCAPADLGHDGGGGSTKQRQQRQNRQKFHVGHVPSLAPASCRLRPLHIGIVRPPFKQKPAPASAGQPAHDRVSS